MAEIRTSEELKLMIENGLFDQLTNQECDRVNLDNQLYWQNYCKHVLPGCSYHFFVEGYNEEE